MGSTHPRREQLEKFRVQLAVDGVLWVLTHAPKSLPSTLRLHAWTSMMAMNLRRVQMSAARGPGRRTGASSADSRRTTSARNHAGRVVNGLRSSSSASDLRPAFRRRRIGVCQLRAEMILVPAAAEESTRSAAGTSPTRHGSFAGRGTGTVLDKGFWREFGCVFPTSSWTTSPTSSDRPGGERKPRRPTATSIPSCSGSPN